MYCPKCFNDSLSLKPRGVIHLIINGKQMDAGRFLFNLEENDKEQLVEDLKKKINEFFAWYSNFQNKSDIEVVQILTEDMLCEHHCAIPLSTKYSIVDIIIPKKTVLKILKEIGEKYGMVISLEE